MVTSRAGLKSMQPMQPHWAPRLWGPAPWCLGRLFIFARYTLHLFSRNAMQISLLIKNALIGTSEFPLLSNVNKPGPSPAGGPVVPGPPFEIGAPHFAFGPLVATYIQYCVLKMWPPSGFWPPLLLNPGDGPVANVHISRVSALHLRSTTIVTWLSEHDDGIKSLLRGAARLDLASGPALRSCIGPRTC